MWQISLSPVRTRRAFTLIETLVTVALTAAMFTVIAVMIQYFYRTNAYALEEAQAVASARVSIENLTKDLRGASYGADGSYPITEAATSSITFYTDLGADGVVEKVRYHLFAGTLYRSVTEPSGTPPSYPVAAEQTTLVVPNIRNGTTSLFQYFDAGGAELLPPVHTASVASVRITVLADVNPDRAPNVYTFFGSATLRNVRGTTP